MYVSVSDMSAELASDSDGVFRPMVLWVGPVISVLDNNNMRTGMHRLNVVHGLTRLHGLAGVHHIRLARVHHRLLNRLRMLLHHGLTSCSHRLSYVLWSWLLRSVLLRLTRQGLILGRTASTVVDLFVVHCCVL